MPGIMTDIEELKHSLEVLKEHDLPVSPILEYAIKERIEQLSQVDKNSSVKTVMKKTNHRGMVKVVVRPSTGGNKKPTILRVIRADGSKIECEKAASTLCRVIKEIGIEKVYALKIPMDGMSLVTIGGNPLYPSAQHDVGNNYFVNVHSNTITKKRQLERVFEAFNLNWKVEIVEPK